VQEDVEQAIQRECEVRFSLAHSAPIMMTLLGECLCYLSDKELARSIIAGRYYIPSDMDPATKMILEEIGRLGMKIVNGKGSEIVITPEDFKRFWRKVKEFTSLSMSGYTTDIPATATSSQRAPRELPELPSMTMTMISGALFIQ
jgi:hypothetical protein